jgi:hypothetical protein
MIASGGRKEKPAAARPAKALEGRLMVPECAEAGGGRGAANDAAPR